MVRRLASEIGSDAADRFLREAEIAAKLSHPNILPVYDSGEADGILCHEIRDVLRTIIVSSAEPDSLRHAATVLGPGTSGR